MGRRIGKVFCVQVSFVEQTNKQTEIVYCFYYVLIIWEMQK